MCVQVCVCLMWHIWARLCESEWACTGVNLYDIPQPSPSATTYPADCGHMSVYFSLPPAGHECAYLIELKAYLQSRPLPIFFFSCEKASCYYYESNGGCSFLAQESRPAERASNAQKMKMTGKLSGFLWPTSTLLAICI